jgi:hypothetical protein
VRDGKIIRATIEAFARGYRVDEDGIVQGLRGPRRCTVDDAGFYRFNIWTVVDGKKTRLHVYPHKLAAYQVFGEQIRDESRSITFKNGDRQDLRPSNITLATRSEIMMARHTPLLRLAYAINAARSRRALTESQLDDFRAARAGGASLATLCERYGIAKSTASYIANGRTYA